MTWITLTDRGSSTVDRLYEAHRETVAALYDGLAPEQKAALPQSMPELAERTHRSAPAARRTVGVAV